LIKRNEQQYQRGSIGISTQRERGRDVAMHDKAIISGMRTIVAGCQQPKYTSNLQFVLLFVFYLREIFRFCILFFYLQLNITSKFIASQTAFFQLFLGVPLEVENG
jgi:hypothetical protein